MQEKKPKTYLPTGCKKILLYAVIFAPMIAVFSHFVLHWDILTAIHITTETSKIEQWGSFGDYVAGLFNPIISSIALYFLYRTYLSQKKQLKTVERQIKLQEEQHEKQKTESRFFELFRIYLSCSEKVFITIADKKHVGFLAFPAVMKFLIEQNLSDTIKLTECFEELLNNSENTITTYRNAFLAMMYFLDIIPARSSDDSLSQMIWSNLSYQQMIVLLLHAKYFHNNGLDEEPDIDLMIKHGFLERLQAFSQGQQDTKNQCTFYALVNKLCENELKSYNEGKSNTKSGQTAQ